MRSVSLLSALLGLCLAAVAVGSLHAKDKELTARELLDRVDDLYRGDSAHGRMTMEVVTKHWQRTLSLEFWSKGTEKSLVRILSPSKERGTATLRVENDIWNYLPKVSRVIKVPSSMMGSSWMGSHFTNNDLVKESRMTEDYTFEITFDGERAGEHIVEIEATPKPDAAVVWGKVIAVIDRDNLLPKEMRYLDEDLELARTMTFSDIRKLKNRTVPMTVRVTPADEKDEYTEVRYDEVNYDVKLDDGVFTKHNLRR